MMLIFLVGFGFLIYYLFLNGKTTNGGFAFQGTQSPEELLKSRYVNGEIDEKTYLQMKETLKG